MAKDLENVFVIWHQECQKNSPLHRSCWWVFGGMSLIKRLREHTSRQHLPVIVISGHADMEDVTGMLRLQVLDLFRKPIYHVRLLETLNNLFPQPHGELAVC